MATTHLNLDSRKTTEAPEPPEGATITVKPSPSILKVGDEHHQRRLFLGPMPTDVASAGEMSRDKSYNSSMSRHFWFLGFGKKPTSATLHRRSLSSEEGISRERALKFFLNNGGKEEDFDKEEAAVRQEMLRKVKQTRWLRSEESDVKPAVSQGKQWVGDSFEIGKDVFGISTLATYEEEPPVLGRASLSENHTFAIMSPDSGAKALSDVVGDTAVTPTFKAKVHEADVPKLLDPSQEDKFKSHLGPQGVDSPASPSSSPPEPGSSQTRLLSSPRISHGRPSEGGSGKPKISPPSSSASLREAAAEVRSAMRQGDKQPSAKGKGKAHVTFYGDEESIRHDGERVATPEVELPASPTEVLTREPSPSTSAGVVARFHDELEPNDNSDVVIRDRMLFRVLSTTGGVQKYMDEKQLLEMPEVRKERATMWREYLVVWRKLYLELYEPYTITAKEWVTGRKHLAYRIPLVKAKTTVSVFSNVDMSICITCPKASAYSHLPVHLNDDKRTTLIFICKTKSRSRSVDWIWRLWRKLGGEVPDSVEIRCPDIDARVNFPIPAIDPSSGIEGYKAFTRERVIQICKEQMSGIPEWDLVIESALKAGQSGEAGRLELCWRTENKLDWAWLDEDVDGVLRPWSVLFGLALKNPRFPSELELRVADHFPTKLSLGDGTTLHEPPSLEGYLYRYKTETHIRDPTYLATHNSNIFFLSPQSAHPPEPPTIALQEAVTVPDTGLAASPATASASITRASEVQRGAAQILNAKFFLDMRNILSVKRAKDPWATKLKPVLRPSMSVRERTHSTTTHATTNDSCSHDAGNAGADTPRELPPVNPDEESRDDDPVLLSPLDAQDEGGDDVLNRITGDEKQDLKRRRSFEIEMRNSEIIRFEAFSCKVAVEWVTKLRELVDYWTRKHRLDARLEMDIVHANSGRTRFLVPRAGENVYPAPPPDPREASPLLGTWWHWCVLNGCRSIIRAGRLYMATGAKEEMRHYYFVLVAGHLVRFRLISRSHSITSMHSHAKTINLLDAYVTSGYFAALELGEGNKVFEPTSKRFQDGLETDDTDMDTLIIIRYRKLPTDQHLEKRSQHLVSYGNPAPSGAATQTTKSSMMGATAGSVPPLNSKHKLLVLRARSKLERDAWCWALNAEIERVVRLNAAREQAIRQDGTIDKT